MGAEPVEILESAMQNLKLGKCQLLQVDKENVAGLFKNQSLYQTTFLFSEVATAIHAACKSPHELFCSRGAYRHDPAIANHVCV